MSMRVRDLQQYLGKFTEDQKGTAISNCHLYIETASGHLEEIRKIEKKHTELHFAAIQNILNKKNNDKRFHVLV